ncbi:hypothetical protein [Sphingobacterium multivorum]|uniref:hypothetical protein n=1 Tax=Sphingobacterium multivorum TaxID=28454 RepID=UPI0028B24A5E|nr:hypothetical protein [Sphingobacterium multivorum]
MEQALIEMAIQIAKLKEENEKLKLLSSKPTRKKKIDPSTERVNRWVSVQYQRGFDEALKECKDRLTQINVHRPVFIPINDCMEVYGQGKKMGDPRK